MQQQLIRRWAQLYDVEIVREFVDTGTIVGIIPEQLGTLVGASEWPCYSHLICMNHDDRLAHERSARCTATWLVSDVVGCAAVGASAGIR